ncbi:MAG: hypothetical protein ING89_16220 [Rubrivivax sp.]|jgi:hypothetical protein|nr:hypothetical protein [Rubrivivax sp.]
MQGYWLTVAWGLGSLLAVSVLVALVEYLREGAWPKRQAESPLRRAMSVDLDVDNWPADAPPPPPHDAESRRAALTQVLQRLQQGGPDAPWVETSPSVLAPRSDATSP